MNNDGATVLEIGKRKEVPTQAKSNPLRGGARRIVFGICCYAGLAGLYFLMPNKPVLSFGRLKYTLDALLEVVFTVVSLPGFFLVYRYGATTFEENLDFAVPELGIELLLLTSMVWVALSNGIHLASKLSEQIIASRDGQRAILSSGSIHYLRQVVGHVAQHVGWQMLFAALMLSQLKRPYRPGRAINRYMPCWGIAFGLLFTQGTIAAGCMTLGFTLTLMSYTLFSVLSSRSGLLSQEIPVLRFFQSSQLTFLLTMTMYWSVVHFHP